MKTKQEPVKIIVEVRHAGDESSVIRERKIRKRLRELTYFANDMLKQMKNPTQDYAICLNNLRGAVEESQRWDSTTPEGMV